MSDLIIKVNSLLGEIENFKQTGKPATQIFEEFDGTILGKDFFEPITNEQWLSMAKDMVADNDCPDIIDINIPSDFEVRLMSVIGKSDLKISLSKFIKQKSVNGKITYRHAENALRLLLDDLT